MALKPFFSMSAVTPYFSTYDPSRPNKPYSIVSLDSYGGVTSFLDTQSLSEQFNNDEIVLGHNPVKLDNHALNLNPSTGETIYQQCSVRLIFKGSNVSTENQYLLIFALRGIQVVPTAQFFVGSKMVSAEKLDGDEQHALLVDCPGDNKYVDVFVRLASPNASSRMGFKGVVGYLL